MLKRRNTKTPSMVPHGEDALWNMEKLCLQVHATLLNHRCRFRNPFEAVPSDRELLVDSIVEVATKGPEISIPLVDQRTGYDIECFRHVAILTCHVFPGKTKTAPYQLDVVLQNEKLKEVLEHPGTRQLLASAICKTGHMVNHGQLSSRDAKNSILVMIAFREKMYFCLLLEPGAGVLSWIKYFFYLLWDEQQWEFSEEKEDNMAMIFAFTYKPELQKLWK